MRFVVADYKGLVTVDSMKFNFAYKEDLCQDNILGTGIKVSPELESKKAILEEMCQEISKAVLKYREKENEGNYSS